MVSAISPADCIDRLALPLTVAAIFGVWLLSQKDSKIGKCR
jgi:hypothetical protein